VGIRTASNIRIINRRTPNVPLDKLAPGAYQGDYYEKMNISPLRKMKLRPEIIAYQKIPLRLYLNLKRIFKKVSVGGVGPKNKDDEALFGELAKAKLIETSAYTGGLYRLTSTGANLLEFHRRNRLIPFAPESSSYGELATKSSEIFIPEPRRIGNTVYAPTGEAFGTENEFGEFLEFDSGSSLEDVSTPEIATRLVGKENELNEKFSSQRVVAGHPVLFDTGSGDIVLAVKFENQQFYITTQKRFYNWLAAKHGKNVKIRISVDDLEEFTRRTADGNPGRERNLLTVQYADAQNNPLGYVLNKSLITAPDGKRSVAIATALRTLYTAG
jgi:hypothetical protein